MEYKKTFYKLLIIIICVNKIYSSEWEEIDMICPNQCVCQYSHFMDLSIARWANSFETSVSGEFFEGLKTIKEDLVNDNEVSYENDRSYLNNPFIKFTICLLQTDANVKILIASLPQDVQALVLLHTGIKNNFTVYTSDIASLPELEILEIRGDSVYGIHLIIDEPIPQLKYINFESIKITSSEQLKRRTDIVDPSENFHYVPNSEKFDYNVTHEKLIDIEIVPYDVYIMAIKKSRTISFYGWIELNVLRIHECNINELEWEIFDGLEKLQHLSLEHNNLEIIPPFSFYGVPHIKSLSLAHNNIINLNYRGLAGLLDLVSIDLSYNKINKLSELTFPPFPKLKFMDLRENPIKHIFPSTFGIMNNTRVLHIGDKNTILVIEDKQTFQYLNQLRFLSIFNIQIEHLRQSVFKGLHNLNTLKIMGQIKYIEYDGLSELPKLKELLLKNCKIEELSMDALYGLHDLEIIDLSHNKLQNLPSGIFDDKKNLKEIYLNNNLLAKLPKEFFNGNTAKLIRLTGNPWYCTCEMINWKQGITNKVRGNKIRTKCINTMKNNNCKIQTNNNNYHYVYDNKMSPRCDGGPDNVLHRSIYYALRRDFKCNRTEIIQEKLYSQTIMDKTKKITKNKTIKYDEMKLNTIKKNIVDYDKEKLNDRKLNTIKTEPNNYDVKLDRQKQYNNKYMNTIQYHNLQVRNNNPKKYFNKQNRIIHDDENNLTNTLL